MRFYARIGTSVRLGSTVITIGYRRKPQRDFAAKTLLVIHRGRRVFSMPVTSERYVLDP